MEENYNDTFSYVDEGLHLLLENRIFCMQGKVTFHKHKNVIVYLPTLTPAGWKLRSHAGSRLRANFSRLIEKCELLPSCLTQFPKYVNSDPCKEQKPCVKWINDNTFLAISDFADKCFLDNFAVSRLRTSSEDFGLFWKTLAFSGIFGNDCVVFKNPSTPKIKTSCLYLRKSWQVYDR